MFQDGCLVGSILLGDTSAASVVEKAIETKSDVSGLLQTRPSADDVLKHLTGA